MGILKSVRLGAGCGLLAAASLAHATSYDLSIDVRAVESNGRNSYLDAGQGKLRYDEDIETDIAQAPRALVDVYAGRNTGKKLVKLRD